MSENATPMTERVENHQNIKMKMQIKKIQAWDHNYNLMWNTSKCHPDDRGSKKKQIHCKYMESPIKNQIQCKYGKKKTNPMQIWNQQLQSFGMSASPAPMTERH